LTFPVLSDRENAYAKALGLVFELPEDLREVYAGFGIVLPDSQGYDAWELPLPARLVVDAGGTVRSVDADPDYTRRPEPEASLAVLRSLG
jgi:peroxiredoxin